MFSIQCRLSVSLSLPGSPPGATMPQEVAFCGILGEPYCVYDATYSTGAEAEPVIPVRFGLPSASDVAPTAITLVSQAGAPTPWTPELPEAATTIMCALIA